MVFINVENVSKEYKIYRAEEKITGKFKSLFKREYFKKVAVDNLNFKIDEGESVGYIGMNGAGKSTTIKMLSGVLTPSKGNISVGGIIPYKNRRENAFQMGVIYGQRSRLVWDLPFMDTFKLYKNIYDIEDKKYYENLEWYSSILGLNDFSDRPVRMLSLGEKMRANIALALLHDPKVVYLDEPTIGLDIVAKSRMRDLIKKINSERNVTVILTSHDMEDIEKVCNRIILIHKGLIIFDGSAEEIKCRYGNKYKIVFESSEREVEKEVDFSIIREHNNNYIYEGDKQRVPIDKALNMIVASVKDISSIKIIEMSMEDIVMNIVK